MLVICIEEEYGAPLSCRIVIFVTSLLAETEQ